MWLAYSPPPPKNNQAFSFFHDYYNERRQLLLRADLFDAFLFLFVHCIISSFFFSFSHFFSSGRKWRWPRYAIVPRSLDEQRQHIESLLGETSSFGSLLEEKSPGASSSSISSLIMRWLPFWVFCRTSSPCTPHALSTRSVRHINLMTSWILMKWIEKDQPTAVGVAYRLITST